MLQSIPKLFEFKEERRSLLTFSDASKIRLNPQTNQLELRVQSYKRATGAPIYSTDTDLTVTTWTTNPLSIKQWRGFAATPRPTLQPAGASVRYKLNDGTNDLYWNGSVWVTAGAADWNDEATVAANIGTFPVTSKTLGFVINLVTTDSAVTPTLKQLCLLMDCEIDYFKSLVADSLIVSLRQGNRLLIDYTYDSPGGTTLDLRDLETAYNIVDVDAVYDHTNDPDHATDLLNSYNVTTKSSFLSSAIERGNTVWFRLEIEPEVYLEWGSQDYTEVSKIPAIVLENFDAIGNTVSARFEVPDISSLNAVVRRKPFRLRLEFDVVLVAEKNRTLLPMLDKSLEYTSKTHLLHWRDLDEQIDLTSVDEGVFRPRANLKDEHTVRFSMVLHNVYLWLEPEEIVPLVQQVNLTFASEQSRGGQLWTGVKTGQPC